MTTFTIVLFLVLAVVLSSVVASALPGTLPRPVVQIALGVVIGLVANLRVTLEPDLFFLLFLPPLLFLDGWRVPTEELLENRTTIIQLALGLVLFTVLGAGLLVHWIMPTMPLAVAFALAAVLSPTDPIAVSAVASHVPVPRRLMRILEGESLLNDASGLVCLRFAVAAAVTGAFSLPRAALTFLWIAAGGLAVGALVVWLVTRAQRIVAVRLGDETGAQILTNLLIPFAAYLAAEELGCSGILAAVAAGVGMSAIEESGRARAATRVGRTAVWNVVQYAANGVMFVLLGEQLPQIVTDAVRDVRSTGARSAWWLVVYVIVVTGALAVLRFVWVLVSFHLSRLAQHHEEHAASPRPNWRLIAATSVAGVRGAVTLAGILTLPLALPGGAPFPERTLASFIAAGVSVLSLLVASLGLPLLLRGIQMPARSTTERQVEVAESVAYEAAIRGVQRAAEELPRKDADANLYASVAARITDVYRARLTRRSQVNGTHESAALGRQTADAERTLWLAAIRAERDAIFGLMREHALGSDVGSRMIEELDLREASYRA